MSESAKTPADELCASVRGLRVAFGGREILHGIDADFPARRVSVILGRSGSGKSTLLRSLNRLNECFDGWRGGGDVRVRLGGSLVPVSGAGAPALTELRRRAGMVFQNPNPLPVSVRRNITLPLELTLGVSRAEAESALRRTLEQTGLWDEVRDRLDVSARSLSGGQQQRLCLARALALSPDLLLLDEPTASLDRAASRTVEDLILALAGKISVIMVSHSLRQASRLADYAVIMAEGRVLRACGGDGLKASLEDGSLVREAF